MACSIGVHCSLSAPLARSPTWASFLYLAVVLDAFSRRIVGWSMATTLHTQVVLDALDMALWQRRRSLLTNQNRTNALELRAKTNYDLNRFMAYDNRRTNVQLMRNTQKSGVRIFRKISLVGCARTIIRGFCAALIVWKCSHHLLGSHIGRVQRKFSLGFSPRAQRGTGRLFATLETPPLAHCPGVHCDARGHSVRTSE